jgi:hypothetical protein
MEPWLKDLMNVFEISWQQSEQMLDELAEIWDEALADTEEVLMAALTPVAESMRGFEEKLIAAVAPVQQTVQPLLAERPACVGCRHYHGESYGGNFLVCGMYPYGHDGPSCPDWQSAWE